MQSGDRPDMNQKKLALLAGLVAGVGSIVAGIVATVAQIGEFGPLRIVQFGRPDVIKPKRGLTIPSGDTFPVTVYEYVDKDRHITTGRTITYSFPPSYYFGLLPRPGESALTFGVHFDLATGKSWKSAPEQLLHPDADQGARAEAARRKVAATISFYGSILAKSEHLNAAKARGVVDVEDISVLSMSCYGEYHWIGSEICGFEMFEHCSRHNPMLRKKQAYPFNVAAIFARPDGMGGYDRIVECNHTDELGWCRTQEPHPVAKGFEVYFGGPNLCQVNEIVAAAKELLDRHVTEETGPREGWGKPYSAYGEK